jgi:hypothetical protein
MNKILVLPFLFLVAFTLPNQAKAMDHRSQWGVGGALGGAFPAPWAQREFEDRVGAGPATSAWLRYITGTPEIGVEFSHNYFQLSEMKLQTHAFVMSFISRQNPWGWFHPFYGFGVGYQFSTNWYPSPTKRTDDWEHPVFKLTAGIEFELSERLDVGFYFNHFTIFKNEPSEATAHVITPVATINYYFGTPAPIPPAAAPAPVPVPTASPAAPAPTVAKPAPAVEEARPAPAKPKGKVPRTRPKPKKKGR